jgi:putative FmdB family regulatory protein
MPIYEYRCGTCGKRSSILVLNPRSPPPAGCRHCGSSRLERLLSRFAAPKSEEARLESLADPGHLDGVDERDPHSIARFMKKMGQEMGEDVGNDLEAMMEQAGDSGNMRDDAEATDGIDSL